MTETQYDWLLFLFIILFYWSTVEVNIPSPEMSHCFPLAQLKMELVQLQTAPFTPITGRNPLGSSRAPRAPARTPQREAAAIDGREGSPWKKPEEEEPRSRSPSLVNSPCLRSARPQQLRCAPRWRAPSPPKVRSVAQSHFDSRSVGCEEDPAVQRLRHGDSLGIF